MVAALAPDLAVTSELLRASVTTAILGHHDARLEPALREIDVGVWQGRAIPDFQAEDAAAYAGWRAGTHRPEGGEDWPPFAAPVQQAIRQEAVSGGASTLLFVCHGGVISAALDVFLGLRPQHVPPLAPASLTVLRLNGDAAKLELYNFRPGPPELGAPD
jgi:probable phosphoglycerate mutase